MLVKDLQHLFKEKYREKITFKLFYDTLRLFCGEPLAYVIGNVPFLGATIDLFYRPLIPRPETEFWIEHAIKIMRINGKKSPLVLDMFSGSGCIGIAVLAKINNARVTFTDTDPDFIAQIKKNLHLNMLDIKQAVIIQSDVFKNISGTFDYILANPPYIPERSRDIAYSVTRWEPRNALFGGVTGLDYIRQFLHDVPFHIRPGGKVFMELNISEKEAVEDIAKKIKGCDYEFWKDHYGAWRVLVLSF